ncbi:hypothetical protein K1X22_29020 [Mycolicibacterium farcinogenes]|uniref:hypothetical protein n=1 Tax=Mycolicibacterium TaxID=1866885 RepID=UPI001C8EF1EA|nr:MULTISPECIES: hypothetical protein [Mycolicibacterium]MED5813304.1 hypothetical protein [Mycolicibacterium sp. 050232]QZH60112.1 hypothetical protein K1X22_29020 [Mycolicibacterium farcinogenes]
MIDGTGQPERVADLAINDGLIAALGRVDERGRREIDADGAIVAPGFVDIYIHYDGKTVVRMALPSAMRAFPPHCSAIGKWTVPLIAST